MFKMFEIAKFLVRKIKNVSIVQVAIRHNHQSKNSVLSFGEDVALAKEKGLPVVALESTIITHGMPYPDNLSTALEVEDIIRQKGVIPATIAVLDGKIKVGINREELERLSKNNEKIKMIKISRRDFSFAASQSLSGGTTVSGTMLIAQKAGIRIMATGGIGGVHRQVESSMDISADLKELGQTAVAVVCSGVKAILDISKTLEYLESLGVPVVSIGPTDEFPAFYSRRSWDTLRSPMRLDNAEEAARLIAAQERLQLKTAVLLAVPVPEPFAFDPQEIEQTIKKALQAASLRNEHGKSVTPFLLSELSKLTEGRSLRTNKALIKNNAGVAADIALHLTKLQNAPMTAGSYPDSSAMKQNPVVIGGATFDMIMWVKEAEIKLNGSTHRGKSYRSCGGVGRNLAAALVNLGMTKTKLLSVIGNDEAGRAIINSLGDAASTLRTLSNIDTARYTAVVDNKGHCCFGIGEMETFMKIDNQFLQDNQKILESSSFLVMDGNLPLDTMELAIDIAVQNQIPVWYEPTDVRKVLKIFQCRSEWQKVLKFISPNLNELKEIAKYFSIPVPFPESDVNLENIQKITEDIVDLIPVVIATLGAQGVLVSRKSSENEPLLDRFCNLVENSKVQSRLYLPPKLNKEIISVSGCGDCLAAGVIAGILRGWKESSCISLGLQAANESLTSLETVPKTLELLPKTQEHHNLKYSSLVINS